MYKCNLMRYMYNKKKYLYKMTLFNIINTVTRTVFGRHIDTHTEHTTNAHTLYRREAHVLPVVYENHDPIVECFDMNTDSMSVDNAEFASYANLQDDIDIHNVLKNQSIVLHDTLYINYEHKHVYVNYARSKDLVYNTNTATAQTLNAQKFSDNYNHNNETSTQDVYYDNLDEHTQDRVSFVASSMLTSPINILNIARGMFGNVVVFRKSASEVRGMLQNTSFVFDINNYEVMIHNADTISVTVQRMFAHERVCGMCAHISFSGNEGNNGYIEYTDIQDRTNYTRNIRHSFHDDSVHNDTMNAVVNSCSVQNMNTQIMHVTSLSTNVQSHNMTTQNVNTTVQYINLTTQNTNITHMPQTYYNHMHIALLLYMSISTGIVSGMIVCAALFKPVTRCVKRCFGIIPLNTEHEHIPLTENNMP